MRLTTFDKACLYLVVFLFGLAMLIGGIPSLIFLYGIWKAMG